MYKNLTNVASILNLTLDNLLSLNKIKLKKLLSGNEFDWRAGIIKELLLCKEGQMFSNLNRNEIDILLNDICVN